MTCGDDWVQFDVGSAVFNPTHYIDITFITDHTVSEPPVLALSAARLQLLGVRGNNQLLGSS